MIDFLNGLEPSFIHKDEMIYNELDDITEIHYIMNGLIDIGYEVNRK